MCAKATASLKSKGSVTKVVAKRAGDDADKKPLVPAEKQALKECEDQIEKNVDGFMAVGEALKRIRDDRLYRDTYGTFEEYCEQRWDFTRFRGYQLIGASDAAKNIAQNVDNCLQPTREAHVRPLARLEPAMQVKVWNEVVAAAKEGGVSVTAALVEQVRKEIRADKEAVGRFNKTNENIDWAKWSWNPVTGCKHGCEYCYARREAALHTQSFPKGFEPHLREERLAIPATMEKVKTPVDANGTPLIRNVFTCSMADLFGKWVSETWIEKVMKAVREAPSWNFLFLTKNPSRLPKIDWPDNAWVGATVDRQSRVAPTVDAMKKVKAKVRFLSCEPLLELLTFPPLKGVIDWMVIGAQSRRGDSPEVQPEVAWVQSLMRQARRAGCQVYCKPNLKLSICEYPGCGGGKGVSAGAAKIYTIGYGRRRWEEFLKLLKDKGIRAVVDVRKDPYHARNGWYARTPSQYKGIESRLADAGIQYYSFTDMGNHFRTRPDWPKKYQELLDSDGDAIVEPLQQVPQPFCLMCSEALVKDCHRKLIADYLSARGHSVEHIEDVSPAPQRS